MFGHELWKLNTNVVKMKSLLLTSRDQVLTFGKGCVRVRTTSKVVWLGIFVMEDKWSFGIFPSFLLERIPRVEPNVMFLMIWFTKSFVIMWCRMHIGIYNICLSILPLLSLIFFFLFLRLTMLEVLILYVWITHLMTISGWLQIIIICSIVRLYRITKYFMLYGLGKGQRCFGSWCRKL